jgi:dynein heavy chain
LWPTEALYSVASRQYIAEQDALNIKENIEQLSKITVYIHNSVQDASDKFYDQLRRKNYVTPTSYLELVKTFIKYLKHQQELIPSKMNRYEVGLRKLAETNVMVEELQKSLITLKPEIAEKEIKVQGLVEELKRESAIAIEQEKTTAKDEAECRKGQAEVMKI